MGQVVALVWTLCSQPASVRSGSFSTSRQKVKRPAGELRAGWWRVRWAVSCETKQLKHLMLSLCSGEGVHFILAKWWLSMHSVDHLPTVTDNVAWMLQAAIQVCEAAFDCLLRWSADRFKIKLLPYSFTLQWRDRCGIKVAAHWRGQRTPEGVVTREIL